MPLRQLGVDCVQLGTTICMRLICCCTLQAVENFLALCQGVEVGGRRLSYVGTPFTRVVKRFVVQAGDVLNKDGTGRWGARGGGGGGGDSWALIAREKNNPTK
jgi:cyclophilin family peptidyl-prolyl cis-trans isomerase